MPDRVQIWSEPEYDADMHVEDLGEGRLMHFLHLDVYYFSSSILRQMLKQWRMFRSNVTGPLFCMGDVDDDKFARFIAHFSFQYLREIPCTDGQMRRLFVNYGPQAQ